MSNVIRLAQASEAIQPAAISSTPRPASPAVGQGKPATRYKDLKEVARAHGFQSYAVLDISEWRNGSIKPSMSFHGLEDGLASKIASVEDLTNCSVFLMLAETNRPFPFTTGLDCRTNEAPEPSLLDNLLDGLLNMYGLKGGYCVPVCDPLSRRSVVMYFGVRAETDSRYPGLVIDTIETFDALWREKSGTKIRNMPRLTPPEFQCLAGIAEGKTLSQVGEELSYSEPTVAAFVRSLKSKLSAHSLSEVIYRASALGLI